MRPLTPSACTQFRYAAWLRTSALPALALLAAALCAQGCASGAASVSPTVIPPPPPPPPPTPAAVSVSITPAAVSILLGNTQTFVATVTGASDISVTWSVNAITGGNSAIGTISAAGVYTAPPDLPSAPAVQITATSNSDPAKSASAALTIISDIAISIASASAAIELGATQTFHAALASNGHPDTSVRWSLAGLACPAACGSLDAAGNYTAPQILPASPSVALTAQSVADPSQQASTNVTITSNFSLQLSAAASIATSSSELLAATLTPVPGSHPSTILSWVLSGPGCSGASCGVLSVVTTQPLGSGPMTTSATYTAPATPPSPSTVTITVTPQADPAKKAQATIAIQPGIGVSVSPGTVTLAGNHRVTLTAQVFGSSNSAVAWSVNGFSNGTGNVGQICVVASNPCQPLPTGNNLQVDYQAPPAPIQSPCAPPALPMQRAAPPRKSR